MLRRATLRTIHLGQFKSCAEVFAGSATSDFNSRRNHAPPIGELPACSYSMPIAVHHASTWAFWQRKSPPTGTDVQSADVHVSAPTPDVEPNVFPLPESSIEASFAILQAFDAVEKASIAAARAEVWLGSAWFMQGIQAAHSMGLPWWGAVAMVNLSTRLLMSPLMVLSQQATAKMVLFNHNMLHAKKLQNAITKAKNQEEQQSLHRAMQKETATQNAKHGNILGTAVIIPGVMVANATIFVSIFGATSKLMESKAPSLLDGGMLWFTDLTIPDPYFGLPILCTLVTLALVEYGISMTGEQTPMQGSMQKQAEALKWMMRVMSFMFLPAGGYVSAGTAVLWVSNSAFAVAQGICLRSDTFRKGVGLPTMAEMREMSAKIAEVAKPSDPLSISAALDVPMNPVTGKPVTLTEDPKRRVSRPPPPPGTPANWR
ncbi:hypothetical protein CEUSTIGMA_g6310.t1 [Chlamydomonas eustigma]|uniref:Membrane insertase YidC/Oxa/ALB C-terminal domain-containing protein n=1 Tax=Chlamydomonas eustigma TaxID=1157962 RepID=A0A250X711_9CHLO|nr:hypothetical protein CEUSTIGMA_g6310.t1 [Chlamydomonas eustigma]|eukprot:GAX78871.1 hypothetical protein CEUSTIGMA_g6310.t1 [Chlamydomonas eustigma]